MKILVGAVRTLGALLLIALALPLAWRLVSGDYYMQVTGVSMSPTYRIGDVLVVQKPHGDELTHPGQIVVVAGPATGTGVESGQYVHRVHRVTDHGTWLKGDGNERMDPQPMTQDRVKGTPRLVLADWWGTLFSWTQSWAGRLGVGAVALTALLAPLRRNEGDAGHQEPAESSGTIEPDMTTDRAVGTESGVEAEVRHA